MGAIVSCILMMTTWCCCSAIQTVFSSCFGNDKPSTVPPSITSGRKRSVFLCLLSIAISLAYQYGLAPALDPSGYIGMVPYISQYLVDAWYTSGCSGYDETDNLNVICSGNAGVYRVGFVTSVFFLFAALLSCAKPTANREMWGVKFLLYLLGLVGTIFIPNDPLFLQIYMQTARIGGSFFLVFQQLVLIDMAYNINEGLVSKADEEERVEPGSGKKWLGLILAICGVLYIGSMVVIGFLFHFFKGSDCSENTAFLSVTIVMSVILTIVQLSGEEASLLTSAFIVSYGVYCAFASLTKNPNEECNPSIRNDNESLDIVIGVVLTIVTLAWVGWSKTADKCLLSDDDDEDLDQIPTDKAGGGVVLSLNNENETKDSARPTASTPLNPNIDDSGNTKHSRTTYKINLILLLVSFWFSMALTSWGAIQNGGNIANPSVGVVSSWMIIASQWVMYLMYLWTLLAPKLFPDRDFS